MCVREREIESERERERVIYSPVYFNHMFVNLILQNKLGRGGGS